MSHSGDRVERAPQVCSACKHIKKGCDKKLPSCSQCVKRRVECRYGEREVSQTRSKGTSKSPASINDSFIPRCPSIPPSIQATLCPSLRTSLLLAESLSDALPYGLEPSSQEVLNNHNTVSSQVQFILNTYHINVDGVIAKYFHGIHHWLPILSRKLFFSRHSFHHISPSADFSILLLAMRLMIQIPSLDPDVEKETEVLYLITKTLYAHVQAMVPVSLFLLQAGINIAWYEYGNGMPEAAFATVGICARMMPSLGLDGRTCSRREWGCRAWMEEEELLCAWWGVVSCDRTICTLPNMKGRPLATRRTEDIDFLPLEPADLDNLTTPHYRHFVSALSLQGLGDFAREAQSVFLLDKVRAITEDRTAMAEDLGASLYPLGIELQNLLSAIMAQIGDRFGTHCGGLLICILALYTLHRTAIQNSTHQSYRETSHIALTTITRIVVDITTAFVKQTDSFDVEILSPRVENVLRCAEGYIFERGGGMGDVEQLRVAFGWLVARWRGDGLGVGGGIGEVMGLGMV